MAKWKVWEQERNVMRYKGGWSEWEEKGTINAINEEEALIKARADTPEEYLKVKVEKIIPERSPVPMGRPSKYDDNPSEVPVMFQFYIPASLRLAVKMEAVKQNIPMKDLVRIALEKFLEGEGE